MRKKGAKKSPKKRKKVTIEFRGHVKYKLSLQSNFNAFAPWQNPNSVSLVLLPQSQLLILVDL